MSLYTPILQAHLDLIETTLPSRLPQRDGLRDVVVDAMTYACSAGGKRIRPVLTLEFCRLCCGDGDRALDFALAIEMLHSYSLIHDDLPCMDDSPLRRGKAAVHIAFGEDMALLAGDALLNRAFETALKSEQPAENVLKAASVLADCSGIAGMVGGQVIDLQSEGKTISLDVLEALQDGKTAALMIAACQMGAILGGGTPAQIEAAGVFGREIGLSFQIVDDILDATVTAEELGKPVGNDAAHDKNTYVSLLGLDDAMALAQKRTATALEALTMFDGNTADLQHLAYALLHRRH